MSNLRPTWAEINLSNLDHNYHYFKQLNNPKEVIAVVKADAYGHGVVEIVRSLKSLGVRLFAVSLLEEALEIRQKFEDIDILVMGAILSDQLSAAVDNNVIVTVYDISFGLELLSYIKPVRFHVKYDSGMNRLGFKSAKEVNDFITLNHKDNTHHFEGIFTHFATSDDNQGFHSHQLEKFKDLVSKLEVKPKVIHASNSSSALKYENDIDFTTHSRIGISLYGLSLESHTSFLKPVMKIKTKIMQIKDLSKGEYVGYGITYQALEDEQIGVIPIGYADGLIRRNNHGYVDIKGKKYPFVGRICMDYAFVKIDSSVKLHDDVIIMGSDIVSIDDVANRLETISYEVVCQVSKRVPRIYVRKEDINET